MTDYLLPPIRHFAKPGGRATIRFFIVYYLTKQFDKVQESVPIDHRQ